jgi:crotonobetainyl-CoA:carnitine CoA-transferase CaiB-like acyl-CoA transferase
MTNPSALMKSFPTRELDIRRLCTRDPEFRRICEDYEVAVKALRHWECTESDTARVAEYRQLAAELADDIAARLEAETAPIKAHSDSGSR